MEKWLEEATIFVANLYKKHYNRTKYRCISFRFDKNLIDYDDFKNKLKDKNISMSQYFQRCMINLIEENAKK